MLLFRLNIATALAIVAITGDQAHGNHGHDHDDHHHHHSHLRRLNPFSPPPGLCKDDSQPYAIGGKFYQCKADFDAKGGKCKTADQTDEEKAKAHENFKWWQDEKAKGKNNGKNGKNNESKNLDRRLEGCGAACVDWDTTVVTIPVHFHIFHHGSAGRQFTCRKHIDSGYSEPHAESSCKFIQDQIEVLNDGFGGIKMDNVDTQHNANSKIQFCLAGSNEKDDALYDNEAFYLDDTDSYKSDFRTGLMETLNVWVNTADGNLGYARFPTSTSNYRDGVVLLGESMPQGGAEDYQLGDTLTHEIGHWLGLYHTHQDGCSKSAYGDYQEEAGKISSHEKRPTFGCPDPAPDSCKGDGGSNPIHNYMSYTDDSCMDEFTPGQVMEMQSAWELYRHKIGDSESWNVSEDGFTCEQSSNPGPPTGTPPPQPTTPPPQPTPPPTSTPTPNCLNGQARR